MKRLILAAILSLAALALPGGSQAAPHGIRLIKVGTFDQPVYVASPPGDRHRLFVVEKTGRIRIVRDGHTLATPFLDLSGQIRTDGELGVLSMAFPPDYATSRHFDVFYTDKKGHQHVSEFGLTSDDVADPDSERKILDLDDPDFNDNGGQLQFGPDGMLYVSNGDGGGEETGPGDPFHTAQDPNSLFGKILRIGADGQPQIYATGLRNPWRFSFDRKTHALILTDVGQSAEEEVDFLPHGSGEGANLGWPTYEGRILRRPDEPIPNAVRPRAILRHGHGDCAITGGYVSRDPNVPATLGRYLFGDFCGGDVLSVRLSNPSSHPRNTRLHVPQLVSFGEDARGRIYAVSIGGPVYRIARR